MFSICCAQERPGRVQQTLAEEGATRRRRRQRGRRRLQRRRERERQRRAAAEGAVSLWLKEQLQLSSARERLSRRLRTSCRTIDSKLHSHLLPLILHGCSSKCSLSCNFNCMLILYVLYTFTKLTYFHHSRYSNTVLDS